MSVYADVDAYQAACPECGRWRFEHEGDCTHAEPDRCPRCGEIQPDEARCGNCGRHAHDEPAGVA